MISVGVRLAAFNLKEIANLTCTDELDLASIGEKKVALFCCIPDAVKLQLVIAHNLPELGDVKGGQPGAAGNQNAFCGLARDKLSRTF